jgi:hypothetical protein
MRSEARIDQSHAGGGRVVINRELVPVGSQKRYESVIAPQPTSTNPFASTCRRKSSRP